MIILIRNNYLKKNNNYTLFKYFYKNNNCNAFMNDYVFIFKMYTFIEHFIQRYYCNNFTKVFSLKKMYLGLLKYIFSSTAVNTNANKIRNVS